MTFTAHLKRLLDNYRHTTPTTSHLAALLCSHTIFEDEVNHRFGQVFLDRSRMTRHRHLRFIFQRLSFVEGQRQEVIGSFDLLLQFLL